MLCLIYLSPLRVCHLQITREKLYFAICLRTPHVLIPKRKSPSFSICVSRWIRAQNTGSFAQLRNEYSARVLRQQFGKLSMHRLVTSP